MPQRWIRPPASCESVSAEDAEERREVKVWLLQNVSRTPKSRLATAQSRAERWRRGRLTFFEPGFIIGGLFFGS